MRISDWSSDVCSSDLVFRYAIATGRAERNPAVDLIGALAQPEGKHFASLPEPGDVAPMLRALHGYYGTPVVMAALNLAPLVFARPGELRRARWPHINRGDGASRNVAHNTATSPPLTLPPQRLGLSQQRDVSGKEGAQ